SVPAANLSQIDVAQLKAYAGRVSATPELADREPRVIARWVGESRSKVTSGDTSMHLGGDGELNPMQAVLGSLAACDVDPVAMHASLPGNGDHRAVGRGERPVPRCPLPRPGQPAAARLPARRLRGAPSGPGGIRGA